LIHQDTLLYRLRLDAGARASHALLSGRTVYLHVVSGTLSVEGEPLSEGDGASITETGTIDLEGITSCEALLFDLP